MSSIERWYEESELSALVQKELVGLVAGGAILALQGPLGAGKTTLTKALFRQLGVADEVISPTFSYVHEYRLARGLRLFHFDLYRLATLDEFLALGFNEYLDDQKACAVIEWPEVIAPLLHARAEQNRVIRVRLSHAREMEGKRKMQLGPWE